MTVPNQKDKVYSSHDIIFNLERSFKKVIFLNPYISNKILPTYLTQAVSIAHDYLMLDFPPHSVPKGPLGLVQGNKILSIKY
jgi:hypothetical protein